MIYIFFLPQVIKPSESHHGLRRTLNILAQRSHELRRWGHCLFVCSLVCCLISAGTRYPYVPLLNHIWAPLELPGDERILQTACIKTGKDGDDDRLLFSVWEPLIGCDGVWAGNRGRKMLNVKSRINKIKTAREAARWIRPLSAELTHFRWLLFRRNFKKWFLFILVFRFHTDIWVYFYFLLLFVLSKLLPVVCIDVCTAVWIWNREKMLQMLCFVMTVFISQACGSSWKCVLNSSTDSHSCAAEV